MNPIGNVFHNLVDYESSKRCERQTGEGASGSEKRTHGPTSIEMRQALPARKDRAVDRRPRKPPSSSASAQTAFSRRSDSSAATRDSDMSGSLSSCSSARKSVVDFISHEDSQLSRDKEVKDGRFLVSRSQGRRDSQLRKSTQERLAPRANPFDDDDRLYASRDSQPSLSFFRGVSRLPASQNFEFATYDGRRTSIPSGEGTSVDSRLRRLVSERDAGRSSNLASTSRAEIPSSARTSRDRSAVFYFTRPGSLTESDRRRYRQLEADHSDLFSSSEIKYVAAARGIRTGKVKDLDVSESAVINTATGDYTSIGTKALSTCIAVCARGKNDRGEEILGLHHYDGLDDTERVLSELDSQMRGQGSTHNSYYLVGGMMLPEESEMGSYDAEASLLSLRRQYDIRGAKLHVLEGEYDSNGEENMLNVVVTPSDIYFSRKDLYKSH